MRRTLAAAVTAAILLTAPAWAQPRAETTLTDVTLWMGAASRQQQCIVVPTGEVVVTASVARSLLVPSVVTLNLTPMTGAMGGEVLDLTLTGEPTTGRLKTTDGPYCWSVEANPADQNQGLPHVAIRLVHVAP